MLKNVLIFATFSLLSTPAFCDEAELINFLEDELSEIRNDIEARNGAPEDGGFFESDKQDYQQEIDELLDEALQLVTPSSFEGWVERIEFIQNEISKAESHRAELLFDRMEATTSGGADMLEKLFGKEHEGGSIEDIDQQLADLDAALTQLKEDQELVATEFAEDMRQEHGVVLTNSQAKAILYSVNGELIIESSVVLGTLADVERRLAEVMKEQIGAEARRTYTGVASVTRLIHARMLQRHLAAYDGDWLPELAAMRNETQELLAQTEKKAARAQNENVRREFLNNTEVQKRILKVINRYEEMLERRRQQTVKALAVAEERADAAVNTLITLETAANLSSVITESTDDYKAVMDIELPELEQLDSEELMEMLDISRRLGS